MLLFEVLLKALPAIAVSSENCKLGLAAIALLMLVRAVTVGSFYNYLMTIKVFFYAPINDMYLLSYYN